MFSKWNAASISVKARVSSRWLAITARASGRSLALIAGTLGLMIPAFSAGDQFDGMAEVIFVVEVNGGDDRNFRLNDVGGVETAAEADLVDCELHAA